MTRTDRARRLRREMTDAERRLWPRLRGRQMNRYKFRRRMPIEGFIADFACVEAKLTVELDGRQHALLEEQDRRRTEILGTTGYIVVRFWNEEVLLNTEGVVEDILAILALRAPEVR